MRTEQARSRARHSRILDAALEVFTRQGYKSAAVDDIAVAANTSKGGVYFHFPNKEAIFLALLNQAATLLQTRAEEAMAQAGDPQRQLDAALRVVLDTFGGHRALCRLFLVEAFGAGREFNQRMIQIHCAFTELVERHLDRAVDDGVIEPLDTHVAAQAWFGAVNEVVTHWVLAEQPGDLHESYPALRALLLRSVGMSNSPENAAAR